MRWPAVLGGVILAAVAWTACWQQVELVRLRKLNALQTDQLADLQAETASLNRRVAADDRTLRDTAAALVAADQAAGAMDRLRALLLERSQTVADVREAAAALHIREGSAEMVAALRQSTADLDGQIALLAGSDAAAGLAYPQPPPVQVVVNAPAPAVVVEGAYPVDASADTQPVATVAETSLPLQPAFVAYPSVVGFGGAALGRTDRRGVRNERHPNRSGLTLLPGAGAGIPLSIEPSMANATTSPTLIEHEQPRSGRGRP